MDGSVWFPPYLQTDGKPEGVGGLPWFSESGFQQTHSFRALKIWMAPRHHGLSEYRSSIQRDIRLAEQLATSLRTNGDFEVFEPQSLSIVCFHYAPAKLRNNSQMIDDLNKAILEKVRLGGQAFLSSTVLHGRFWLRGCIINPRTFTRVSRAKKRSLGRIVGNSEVDLPGSGRLN